MAEDLKKEEKTGFFHVKQMDGVWWLIDPEGEPFYSIGVNYCRGVSLEFPTTKYGSKEWREAWEKTEPECKLWAQRLKEWNFNTAASVGGNFNNRLPATPIFRCVFWATRAVDLGTVPRHPKYNFPDVYSREFKECVENFAERVVKPQADNPLIIGWFLDNEFYLPQDKAFQEQFYKVVVGAVRKYDKNHMLLGTRHESPNRSELDLRMEAKYCDVLSVNAYGLSPSRKNMQRYYKLTGKPIMLTEFTFAAKDSGLTNARSLKGMILEDQEDRAKGYEIYTSTAASFPYVVGTHFFLLPERLNEAGTPNNWGLLDIDGMPHYAFVSRLTDINAKLPDIHAGKIKPKRYPEDYPNLTFPYNNNPRTRNKATSDDTKNWYCQYVYYYYACTPGTGLYCFERTLDESWGAKKYGFIEYRFEIEKDFDKPFLMLRYSRYPNRPTQTLKVQINNEDPISISLPASIGEPTVQPGWAYGFINQKLNTITIPLKKPIKKGLVNVRFCNTKLWKEGQGVQLHSFFLTNGSSYKVDGENFNRLVPLDSPEKEKTNSVQRMNSPFRDPAIFLDFNELNFQYQ